MNKCCNDLLQEIKKYINEQREMYKSTRRYSTGFAFGVLLGDLVFKYETEMSESSKDKE